MRQPEKQQIGRYEILQEIGRGAMGVVFKGRDPLIGRAVAVKTITAGVAESADLLERFYREARAAGGLQHPNIVTIYELAESGGAPFIAMEYLEGESLEKLIARKPAPPLATKLGYIVQTCRALDYAHRHGVIHRDVKPANIVVTRDGMVKVVDFGIARLGQTSHTQTGMLLGTLTYMSPEQVRGQNADARCDIWSMGVVLYEFITHQRPFTGENHAALLLSILQNEPPPIRQLVPECPVALERIISKSLRKDEKERYPSMEALLKDLENVDSSLAREGSRGVAQTPGGKTNVQPAPTVLLAPPISPAARPSGAAPIGRHAAPQPVKTIPEQAARLASRRWRNAASTCALLTVIVLGAIGIARRDSALGLVRRYKMVALAIHPDSAQNVNLAAPAIPAADVETPAGNAPVVIAAPPPLASIEDQQRHLTDLAHEAADRHDYESAETQLDKAAEMNGPLNGPIAGLRRQFSEQSHGAELQRAARQEQTLWDKAMAYLQDGDLDDAETSLRDILTLPEGGHRRSDAAHYVDQVIPERRRDEQLWAATLFESTSPEPGHLLQEVKTLDELLAAGGTHEQEARQMRDTVITQVILGNARRNSMPTPAVSDADQWQMTRLKNHFDDLVQKGNAAALEELQQLQSEFKSLAEGQDPLATDARDYLNSLIPKAQKHIEESLATAESNSSANAAYTSAVKEYDRAVATQNAAMLRDQVLPVFRHIAQSGGVRAKEARRYADVLIPAALKKSGQQDE
jgi:predicted Ser/Thr protein kinase/tetratricopeptide (TPR) repeat protein